MRVSVKIPTISDYADSKYDYTDYGSSMFLCNPLIICEIKTVGSFTVLKNKVKVIL